MDAFLPVFCCVHSTYLHTYLSIAGSVMMVRPQIPQLPVRADGWVDGTLGPYHHVACLILGSWCKLISIMQASLVLGSQAYGSNCDPRYLIKELIKGLSFRTSTEPERLTRKARVVQRSCPYARFTYCSHYFAHCVFMH